MKVLHFTHCFDPVVGGTSTRLRNLLSDPKNEHYLYVPQAPSSFIPKELGLLKDKENFSNIKVRRCKLSEKSNIRIPVLDNLRYIARNSNKLIESVKETGFDIVQGHNPAIFANAAMNYANKFGLPFIYEVHRLTYETYDFKKLFIKQIPSILSNKICRFNDKKIMIRADYIIAQTETMKNKILEISKVSPNLVHVIPIGIDASQFNPSNFDNNQELRKKNNWEDKTIIMFNGSLSKINGIHFLIDSISELPNNLKNKIKIIFAGKGPLINHILNYQKKFPELFEYIGIVEHAKMVQYYSASDIQIIPLPATSCWEMNVPTKLLEGMAMEKIILASDVGGINTILNDGINGFTFSPNNKASFTEKLSFILKNINNMDNIKKRARKDILQKYTWTKSRMLLQKLYDHIKANND